MSSGTQFSHAKTGSLLANASIVLGILGFLLPCGTVLVLGLVLNDFLITTMGLEASNAVHFLVPLCLGGAAPLAILLGILSLRKRAPEDAASKSTAALGIVLGAAAFPCVLVPLLLFYWFSSSCIQIGGC